MHMTTKILAIGFLMGLGLGATTANATTKPTCQHKTDWSKPCSDPVNSEHWTFNTEAEAEAWAVAVGQGGDASATGGNATGGTAIINEAADPQFTGRAEIVLKAEVKVLDGQHARNVVMLSKQAEAVGSDCLSRAVLEDHPAMQRAIRRSGAGFTVCGPN